MQTLQQSWFSICTPHPQYLHGHLQLISVQPHQQGPCCLQQMIPQRLMELPPHSAAEHAGLGSTPFQQGCSRPRRKARSRRTQRTKQHVDSLVCTIVPAVERCLEEAANLGPHRLQETRLLLERCIQDWCMSRCQPAPNCPPDTIECVPIQALFQNTRCEPNRLLPRVAKVLGLQR